MSCIVTISSRCCSMNAGNHRIANEVPMTHTERDTNQYEKDKLLLPKLHHCSGTISDKPTNRSTMVSSMCSSYKNGATWKSLFMNKRTSDSSISLSSSSSFCTCLNPGGICGPSISVPPKLTDMTDGLTPHTCAENFNHASGKSPFSASFRITPFFSRKFIMH